MTFLKHSDFKPWFVVLQANDSYLQMAIGNAPWPIGVTMVGIHARTGREKIFSQNVARILFFTQSSDVCCFQNYGVIEN